ncbi:MAG: Uma2 family endonuclease, partial [Vulcanimicrobiaceae bacterium]
MSDMALELRPRLFTVSEFHRLYETGIVTPGERLELLDGVLVEMSPIGARHWARHERIVRYLTLALAAQACCPGQISLPLGKRSEPQPDIVILAPRNYEPPAAPPADAEIFAFVELADSSLSKDTGPKLRIYARHGIRDYLVVDLEANQFLHHAEPHQLGYRTVTRLTYGQTFSITAIPAIELRADPFLKPRD